MADTSTRLHEAVMAKVSEMIVTKQEECGDGQADSMRSYGHFCGYIQGLRDLLLEAEEVRKRVLEG